MSLIDIHISLSLPLPLPIHPSSGVRIECFLAFSEPIAFSVNMYPPVPTELHQQMFGVQGGDNHQAQWRWRKVDCVQASRGKCYWGTYGVLFSFSINSLHNFLWFFLAHECHIWQIKVEMNSTYLNVFETMSKGNDNNKKIRIEYNYWSDNILIVCIIVITIIQYSIVVLSCKIISQVKNIIPQFLKDISAHALCMHVF